MNKHLSRFFLPALAALATAAPSYAGAPPARQHILMDADWRFSQMKPTTLKDAVSLTAWRWRPGQPDEAAQMTAATLDTTGADWKDAATGDDVFHGQRGYAWFRATLPTFTASSGRTLHFE